MNVEVWWVLLLPLFFALGWGASRLDLRSQVDRHQGQLPSAYFKGLNFLLADQPDKALDAFVEVVRLEPDTLDLHFALGSLFRRRGEHDRAIRVHQNLLERANLSAEHKAHAQFELGQDYLRAGLLDRAEQAFDQLENTPYAVPARKNRLAIAQMVSDWPQAQQLAQDLQSKHQEDHRLELLHFACELNQLDTAKSFGDQHPRPLLLAGQAAAKQGDEQAALAHWEQLAKVSPDHFGLIAADYMKLCEKSSVERALSTLDSVLSKRFSLDVFSVRYRYLARAQGQIAADNWAKPLVQSSASISALNEMLRNNDSDWLKGLAATHAEPKLRYTCKHCGFQAKTYYWRCPGCQRWDQYSARRL